MAIASLVLVLLPGPTSVTEISALVLLGYFLLRTPRIWRLFLHAAIQPVPLAILAFSVWQLISLSWSGQPAQGLDEISSSRWALMILLLWPVIGWRNRLIAALAIGFLLGNLSQLAQLIWGGQDWFPWLREPDRISGWWDPAVAGSMLTAALGLHLPAAIMGSGRGRYLGLAGSAVTLAAILATGTRGAWIASVGLVVITLIVALVRSHNRKTTLILACAIIAAGLVAGFALRGPIMSRYEAARTEISSALSNQDYSTSTGARIAMARGAIDAFAAHPIRGVGAGGYQSWVMAHADQEHIDETVVHAHAHNALLHIAATTGLVGLALAGVIIGWSFWNAFSHLNRTTLGTYAAGPAFGLLGLLLVSTFDSVHINSQSAAVLGVLLALTPTYIPKAAWPPRQDRSVG